ncbi:PP2C family protein-serine/threonine phosphatase, partial [Rhodococcoides fascians]|uniref:PP2C family protein-serine/threonine phosphatase n=3 Tax=Nocardiaceae TaxID=85025 RepID=UPI001269AB72
VRDGRLDVELASGGHPPALLLRVDGTASYLDTTGGQLVGILPAPRFLSVHVQLLPGDTLVLYTDGLTEARTGVGRKRYDDEGALLEFAASRSPASPVDFVDDLRELLLGFGEGLSDDTAILAFGLPLQPQA